MTSFDHFEMDQLPGKESSNFTLKTRDTSISDSIQSSNNNSLAGSLESLTSPIGLPIGISVLPVKDSLAGLSIAVSQQTNQTNIPAYTTAKQYDYTKLSNAPNALSSVVELPTNKVFLSNSDSSQLATAPMISNSHQVFQIIHAPKDASAFTSSLSLPSEMPNNNNSSNIGDQAVTKYIEFGKPTSLLFPNAKSSTDLAHPQLIPIYPSNNMGVAPPQPKQVLQSSEHAHILLPSQPATVPEGYQILQAIPTTGQHKQDLQQLVIASTSEVSYTHTNQCNGNYQYSIITAPPAVSHPAHTLKPLSPPKQVRTHKHLQHNTRPQQAQIKVEPFYPPHGQLVGNPDPFSQPPFPYQENDHRRSESSSSGPGMPRKRKTGIPRKIVQTNPKVKKERNEGEDEMDTGLDADNNSEEFCGSPYGTDEMEYSPDSDPSASLPATTLVEPHVFPSIMLAEGSKVTFTTWNEYCQLTGSLPAPYALLNQNNSLVAESNLFQVGLSLEILDWDVDRHFAVRLVTVSRIQGSRLRLELMASEGKQPIWTTIDSYRLHYLGWGSERGLTYLPPDDLKPDFNWGEYIRDLIATQDNSNIDMLRPSFDQEMNVYFTLFRPGMLLEAAMDPLNREVISVCVVKKCSGQTVLLYEQNEDELSEFSRFYQEFPVDSQYIRALGWANKHHKQLRPSKESSNSKDWPQLLAKIIIHKNRLPVPLEAFNRTSCFCPGMKLEAVDWKEQETIRVATVIAVSDKQQIKVHYDGLPNEMDYWFDADGKDIFPPGYCDTAGHSLEKPEELDISQAAPAILCQMESANLPHPQVLHSPVEILSQIPTTSSSTRDEVTPPPPNNQFAQEVLQSKVTVTLHISHGSSPGSYLNPELVKQIPTEIGPVTPIQAQAMLLTYLLDASINRQLLWNQIDDCPGPNSMMLRFEQNSSLCKYIPNIESFMELFNFLNKLRERLNFGPDFIRIGTPPATHEVHQPEKIPSSIPPLTLPQSKNIISSNLPHSVMNQVMPNSVQVPIVSSRPNIVQLPPSHKLDPNTSVLMRPPPQYIPNAPSSRAVPMFQNKQKIHQYLPPIVNTRPIYVPPSPHVNIPLSTHHVSTTNIIPPPSNYMNGTSHHQPQIFKLPQPNPASWTVDQVCEFIRSLDHANVEEIVNKFKEQKIDGSCLLELKVDLLVKFMELELGPAMKIIKNIQQLFPSSSQRKDVSISK